MAGPSREPGPIGDKGEPSAIRRAAGLPAGPSYLTSPTTRTSGYNPELRKLVLFGVGLIFCVVLTLVLAPRHDAGPAAQAEAAAPKPEETAEERRQRVQTMFDGAFAKVSDGADFDQSNAFLDVVRGVSRLDAAQVAERADKPFDWQEAMKEPALARGRYVHVRGLIGSVQTIKLHTPAGDVTDVWRCFISEPDGSEKTVIDMVSKPPLTEDNLRRDVVDVDALFLRIVGFDAEMVKKGEKTPPHFETPYLIGRTLTVYVSPPSGPQGTTRIVLLAGLAAAGVVVAVFVARQRVAPRRRHPALLDKPGVGIREMFEMRRREGAARPPPTAPKTP